MTSPSQEQQQHEEAFQLIQQASSFAFAPEEMLRKISELMVLEEVDDGHVFVEEGEEQTKWFILDQGVVARYKLGTTSNDQKTDFTKRSMTFENHVLLDRLEGRGRVTALLHSLNEGHKSYATVAAKGPVKLWSVNAKESRDLLRANGEFALPLAAQLAQLLRKESKVSRALAQVRGSTNDNQTDGSGNKKNTLRVLCYDSTEWVRTGFEPALQEFNKELDDLQIVMEFTEERLNSRSAAYASGYDAICTFVNDTADEDIIRMLSVLGVKMIAQRAAGFDRIDTKAALTFGLTVTRVPAYSPYAVAEMAISLLMALNRKITTASSRVKMANFTLDTGLMGMDIHGKTVGVMGTGKIGAILCKILNGFGVNLLCYDVFENEEVKQLGATYVSKDEIYAQSDVIFLMMPLLPPTRHTINMDMLPKLKTGVLLINTSRGGLIDTKALLEGIKTGIIGGVGMDVFENEADYFFQDWSARHIQDPDLVALLGTNNVVLTAHQAFFTKEAVDKIVSTTLENLRDYAHGKTGLSHPNNCIPTPK
jgi:D-lactate dehydrogenase